MLSVIFWVIATPLILILTGVVMLGAMMALLKCVVGK